MISNGDGAFISEETVQASAAPLFVTRFSLSLRSAIGVQTREMLRELSSWHHVYWEELDGKRTDSRSIRLERFLIARVSLFKGIRWRQRFLANIAGSYWNSENMNFKMTSRLDKLRGQVSVIYLAPLGGLDAVRMRKIVEYLRRPFVLHLWDLLDGPVKNQPDLIWLVERAERVFYLTEEMYPELDRAKAAEQLLFSRQPAKMRAQPRGNDEPLRIALVGNVASYQDGVDRLIGAKSLLNSQGINVEIRFFGPAGVLRRLPRSLKRSLLYQGFIDSSDNLDKELSKCHVAFLPGPSQNPENCNRSRYSVPSRILDFLALGLPIVGCVHPRSATAKLLGENVRDYISASSPERIAALLLWVCEENEWHRLHLDYLQRFADLSAQDYPRRLETILIRVGRGI